MTEMPEPCPCCGSRAYEWIRIEDALPETEDRYLVTLQGGSVEFATYTPGWPDTPWGLGWGEDITHWQPFPPAPAD